MLSIDSFLPQGNVSFSAEVIKFVLFHLAVDDVKYELSFVELIVLNNNIRPILKVVTFLQFTHHIFIEARVKVNFVNIKPQIKIDFMCTFCKLKLFNIMCDIIFSVLEHFEIDKGSS